jgi:hypothetical protein
VKIITISAWINNPYHFREINKTKRKKNNVQNKNVNGDSVFISNEAKQLFEKSVQR